MKNIALFIFTVFVFSACDTSRPFLVGKNNQLVFGNPRVKARQGGKKLIKTGASEFSATVQR